MVPSGPTRQAWRENDKLPRWWCFNSGAGRGLKSRSMTQSEQRHPFYRPLWRRIAIVGFVAFWLGIELLYSRDSLWVIVAGGLLAYAVWVFLINWPKETGGQS